MDQSPEPVSIVVEPHLWTNTAAEPQGEWHAIGSELALGPLSDTIEFHISCSNTDSKIPLDPRVEGQFVLAYITDDLLPLLVQHQCRSFRTLHGRAAPV
jgi:hypothetical protein